MLEIENKINEYVIVITEKQLDAMRKVIDYLFNDEYKDWSATGRHDDHIFNAVKTLDDLYGSV